jgi:putative ABC transport system substrate-binding protein
MTSWSGWANRLVLVCCLLCVGTGPSGSQPAVPRWRIGLCHVGLDHEPPSLPSLKAELLRLGYDHRQNLLFDWRNQATEETALTTVQEWVAAGYNLIVAFEDQCVRSARKATATIPVVFVHASDPVANGYVKSLSHPGTNLTGPVSNLNLVAKAMEVFKETNPGLRTVLMLSSHKDAGSQEEVARRAARNLGIDLLERDTPTIAELERAFDQLPRGVVQGVVVPSPDVWTNFGTALLALADKAGLPVAGNRKERVEAGALFSYQPDFVAVGPVAANYIDRILKGRKPDELPVEEVSNIQLVINLAAARKYGLTIPATVLVRADNVIDVEPPATAVSPEPSHAQH